MPDEPEIDDDMAEEIPTRTDSPIGLMKLQASVEGLRDDIRKAIDEMRMALERLETNYKIMVHEFENRFTEHAARLDTLERRVRRTAPRIVKKKKKRKS